MFNPENYRSSVRLYTKKEKCKAEEAIRSTLVREKRMRPEARERLNGMLSVLLEEM